MQATADAAFLREQAAKCHRLANSLADPIAIAALREMAKKYEDEAVKAENCSAQMRPPGPEV
jgi:hypothetical protein